MAVTGRTGADGFAKAVKKQAQLLAKYGPKLYGVVDIAAAAGALTSAESAAIKAGFNATPALLAAIAKLAEYSGF